LVRGVELLYLLTLLVVDVCVQVKIIYAVRDCQWKSAFVLFIAFLGFTRGKGTTGSCIAGHVFSFMVPLESFFKPEALRQGLDGKKKVARCPEALNAEMYTY